LKFYIKYLNENKYLLRFHNMKEHHNITLNISNLDLKSVQLTGVKTFNEM